MLSGGCRIAARLFAIAALSVAAGAVALAQAPGIDPGAEKILRRMTDYLAGLQQFSVDTHNTLEAVLTSGQKIQFDSAVSLIVQRPNKLRAERKGDLVSQVIYYDGKSLTLYNPSDKFYAVATVPGTLEEMLDFARGALDIDAPAGDLIYKNAFQLLMQDVTSGFIVGKTAVGGVRCDHLAFSGPEVDWQVWVQDGDKPLPRRYVVTTKDVAGWPQYTVAMSNWNVAPTVADARFSFVPPAGARKIDFLPLAAASASR